MFSDRIITRKVFNVAEEDNSDPLFDTMKAESKVEVFFEVKEDQDDNIIEQEVIDLIKHTCPDCYKLFTWKKNLTKHIKVVHIQMKTVEC